MQLISNFILAKLKMKFTNTPTYDRLNTKLQPS